MLVPLVTQQWTITDVNEKVFLCVSGHFLSALTRGSFKYPTARPYQRQAQHSRVEIQLISGESSLDPHGNPDRKRQ